MQVSGFASVQVSEVLTVLLAVVGDELAGHGQAGDQRVPGQRDGGQVGVAGQRGGDDAPLVLLDLLDQGAGRAR
jgi:hypothetical protein